MTEYSKSLDLISGFTVIVKPLPPYYLDFIEDKYPFVDYPKRELTLAGGDILEIDYELPEQQPSADNIEEYELYVRWHAANNENVKLKALRDKTRRDFLLATCVTVQSGPVQESDPSWVIDIESAIEGYKVPTHSGKRRVDFLKAVVIRSQGDLQKIVESAMFPEVTMQGIETALQGFQNEVERGKSRQRHRSKAKSG